MKKGSLLIMKLLKLSIVLASLFLLTGCSSDQNQSAGSDANLLACDRWSHPNSTNSTLAVENTIYNIDENLSLNLKTVESVTQKTVWSDEDLKKSGYIGNKAGIISINIPEDEHYIIWITEHVFITPYQVSEDNLQGERYIDDCFEKLKKGGFLKAVEFSLKKGVNYIQLSHTDKNQVVIRVTKTQI